MKTYTVRLVRDTLEEAYVTVQAEDRADAIMSALDTANKSPIEFTPTDQGGKPFVMDVTEDVTEEG